MTQQVTHETHFLFVAIYLLLLKSSDTGHRSDHILNCLIPVEILLLGDRLLQHLGYHT